MRRDAVRQVANGYDKHCDDDSNKKAPGQIGDSQSLVRRERRDREIRLVQPVPPRNPRKDDGSSSRGHEPGKQRAPNLLRGNLPAGGCHLEQEERGDQRPPEKRGYRREGTRESEELRSRPLHANQPDCDRAETEPERDQRGFRAENESEPQTRERCGKDAGQKDRGDRVCSETLQRRVTAVSRQSNGGRNEQPCQSGYEDDVPPRGLAPSEFVGNHVPHEVDHVVDQRLKEHGRECDGHAEQRREHECSDVLPRFRIAHGRTLLRPPTGHAPEETSDSLLLLCVDAIVHYVND